MDGCGDCKTDIPPPTPPYSSVYLLAVYVMTIHRQYAGHKWLKWTVLKLISYILVLFYAEKYVLIVIL